MNAASRYVAAQYERCIDAGLNLGEIQNALATRGINRASFQIVDDIE
jgi:hypothetical protein